MTEPQLPRSPGKSAEWHAARDEYLREDGDPDEVYARRVQAALRMREIELTGDKST